MGEPLEEIPSSDIPRLLQLLKCDFPIGVHVYSFIETLVSWKKKNSPIKSFILAPNGNYRSEAVLCYFIYDGLLCMSYYTWSKNGNEVLRKSLLETKTIPWEHNNILITCVPQNLWPPISPAIEQICQLKKSEIQIIPGNVYWLPWQEAKNMEVKLPDATYIEDLKPEHAEIINDHWPHKYKDSEKLVAETIKLNFGLGLFQRGNGKLLSWAIHWFYGGIGLVQTLESEKRKGYASAVVQAITRSLGNQGIDVHLNVVTGNLVGDKFFTGLGFRPIFTSSWIASGSL